MMAAIAAKTGNNRVLVIEPSNVLGGQGTAGGVAGFCGDTARVNAPFAELVALLSRHGLIGPYRPNDDRRGYDLEWCAFFLQEMVVASGVEILLHARVVAAEAVSGRVTRLVVSSAGELMHLAPKFVIDASGACIVPWMTGFAVEHEGANRQLPMSLYFTLWDTGKKVTPVLPEGCPHWRHDDEIPMTSLHRFPTGKVEVKMKVVGFDAADGLGRSNAEIFARRQMHGLIYYLQTVGYRGRKLDTHVLAGVSRSIGVREERRIVGEHVLTETEARSAVIFPDVVAINTYHIDYHWPDRMERAGTGVTDMLDPHHLPLRMMIPKGAKNLLVPGRGASGDQTAMSAFRVMCVVAQMGFAAGHAARQCVELRTDLAGLDIPRLQAAITAGGQSLDLSDYGEYLRQDLFAHEPILAAPSAAPCEEPTLVQGRNGRFFAAWVGEDAAIWLGIRSEKKWSAPRRLSEPPGVPARRPQLSRDSTGKIILRFELTLPGGACERVSTDDGVTWSETQPASTKLPACAESTVVALDDGTRVKASVTAATGKIALAVSPDAGTTWTPAREIEHPAGECAEPTLTATRTGLALVFVADRRQLGFWHGSIERVLHGAPTASAHVLQA